MHFDENLKNKQKSQIEFNKVKFNKLEWGPFPKAFLILALKVKIHLIFKLTI